MVAQAAPVVGERDLAQARVVEAPRIDIAIKAAAPEDQVRDQRELGQRDQRDGPGDGPLRGADGQDGMPGGEHAHAVDQEEEGGKCGGTGRHRGWRCKRGRAHDNAGILT